MSLTPGQSLAHYEILELIGKGGMGVVYRARDTKLGRDVAIKVLPDELALDEERLARFGREAKVLASLNHPNIAAIYGLEEAGDTLTRRTTLCPDPLTSPKRGSGREDGQARAHRSGAGVLSIMASVLLVSGGWLCGAQSGRPLAEHLRNDGTELDLRDAAVLDAELAVLAEPTFARVRTVLLAQTDIGDEGLRHLARLALEKLDLYQTQVTDAGLTHLRGLPIESLTLGGTAVTDVGLAHLEGLPLEALAIRDTRITDEGMVDVAKLPLRILDLSYTNVGDVGLAKLQALDRLELLDVSYTKVTDDGLAFVVSLPRLSQIYLSGTAVTTSGIEGLMTARPDVRVHFEPLVR